MASSLFFEKREKRAGHGGDEPLFAVRHSERAALAKSEGASRLYDVCAEDESLALGRRSESRFEFHRENGRVGGHERKGRVTAGAVERGGDDSRVNVAVLLGEVRGVGHRKLVFAGLELDNFHA